MVKIESKLPVTLVAKNAKKLFGTEFGNVKTQDTNSYKAKDLGIEFEL